MSKDKRKIKTIKGEFDRGFWIAYDKIKEENFKIKALDIVRNAKTYSKSEMSLFEAEFSSGISQAIGSILTTLIFKAANEPNDYVLNRKSYIMDIAEIVKSTGAYKEMFEFVEFTHKVDSVTIQYQLMMELEEVVSILTPFNKNIIGLNGNRPIIRESLFPYTKYFVGRSRGVLSPERKRKDRNIENQNYARTNLDIYYAMTYGLYNPDNIDMVPNNCINLEWFQRDAELPRTLDMDILVRTVRTKKKYVMNKNGVVVDCYNAGDIETIVLQEIHGYLLFKVVFNKKGWALDKNGRLVDDINNSEYAGFIDLKTFEVSDKDYYYDYSMLVSIAEYVDRVYSLHEFIVECYADLVCGPEALKIYGKLDSTNEILFDSTMNDEYIEDYFNKNNRIGIRYTPKKLYNEGKRTSSRTSRVTREKYFVSGHIRKLVDGANCSREAMEKASEYGISIPNGYTFVSPYYSGIEKVRSYYKKVVN